MLRGKRFASILLGWYAEQGRQLPWRGVEDPYLVWVSEVILQQTRVAQGEAYYHRFISQFPTVQALAEAPLDAVMKAWQGLGYYTRARNLHRAAQRVMTEFGGKVPSTYAQLLTLPGLGEYAAGAVASIAFGEAVSAIDGNVYRVLARVFGIWDRTDSAAGKRVFRSLSEELLHRERPGDYNQALIDFGALQCRPGMPHCEECVLVGYCYAAQHGEQPMLPVRRKSPTLRNRYFHFFWVCWQGNTYLIRRSGRDIWHSLYQFPMVESEAPLAVEALLCREEVQSLLGANFRVLQVSECVEQVLTHQRLHAWFYIVRLHEVSQALAAKYERVPLTQLAQYQFPVMLANYIAEANIMEFCSLHEDSRGYS